MSTMSLIHYKIENTQTSGKESLATGDSRQQESCSTGFHCPDLNKPQKPAATTQSIKHISFSLKE